MSGTESLKDFDRLREAFQHRFEGLSPHLQRIARYALEDPNRFALQTVADAAHDAEVQPSTLIRFAKTFGFSGFSEMQQVFRLRLIEGATSFRDRIHEHRGRLEAAAEEDPVAILHGFADASSFALDHLKEDIDGEKLREAVRMLDGASSIYVIGQRRAFPVAAYLAYGLVRLEYRCHLLDSVGGMLPQQVSVIGTDDLFVAVSFAEYAKPVVDAVTDAHIRNVPVLAITDSIASPLARNSSICFVVRDAEVHRFRPLAAPIVLAQSLTIALGYCRDARLGHGES
ncbi:MAG: MurR/RpiR family transcriptional regulator [Boseongicola sp.]|nr:MurR/RpiR family transcriptional regulator [Boseongicola sp.]